jgi:hypothetical protein
MPYHWTCPFCDRDTTITDSHKESGFYFTLENAVGFRYFMSAIVVCPNPKCRKFSFGVSMFEASTLPKSGNWNFGVELQKWNLIPPSSAKVFPDYVPKPIRDDYLEACLIRDLSPKASATLSRRCLQGMIRDFWKISKPRLIDEIEALEDKTDALTWSAIDSVRKIGNIGAHMEADINVIVDVEPDEAQQLIWLIELLVKDWYVVRHDREERLKSIVKVKKEKDAAKTGAITPKLHEHRRVGHIYLGGIASIVFDGGWPTLSLISTPEGAPSLCLHSLQTQGGDFDFLSPP